MKKEYLDKDFVLREIKQTNGDNKSPSGWIEVPEGAEFALLRSIDSSVEFRKKNMFFDVAWKHGIFEIGSTLPSGVSIIWKRENVDSEKLDTDAMLADIDVQIATHSQHGHYYKDVRDLNVIDPYMVLKLFNVTDPCLQHIVKKSLVAGGRGHKDLEHDLKDIYDTSKRALEINNIKH